jgi:hypothetical protein
MHDKHNSSGESLYYRNKNDLESREGIEVEAGSLWKLNPETSELVLVDEDQHITAIFDTSIFQQID